MRMHRRLASAFLCTCCCRGQHSTCELQINSTECRFAESTMITLEDQMLQCDACGVCVHMACYGVQQPPNGRLWLCDVCALRVAHFLLPSACAGMLHGLQLWQSLPAAGGTWGPKTSDAAA